MRSLTAGPKDFDDALKGPLWKRLLISEKEQASNVIVLIEEKENSKLIRHVEDLIRQLDEKDFRIRIAGAPYVVEMIRRNVVHDFTYFSATAVILFGVAMGLIFRSLRIVIGMLGAAGFLKIPVDIISAPAANVCIGMAVDSMIHLIFAVRRNRGLESDLWKVWVAARDEQWRAVLGSAAIIMAGFAIFTLSSFPPTQRFGLVVIFGTLIDIAATLLILPLFAGANWRTVSKG